MRRFPLVVAIAPALLAMPGGPVPAAPAQKAVIIVSPVAAAKTFQVTETYYTCGDRSAPGPLRLCATMTFSVRRPDKFRIDRKEYWPRAKSPVYYISDGHTLFRVNGRETTKIEFSGSHPFPLVDLVDMHGPVSVVPTVRNGCKVLLAVQAWEPADGSRTETLYDRLTYLPLEETMFTTWQGKTNMVSRTVYTGWVLNRPVVTSVFKP